MNANARLKRLEQLGSYPLRIIGIYKAMCDMDESGESDFVAALPVEDLLSVARVMYLRDMMDYGVEAVRTLLRESFGRFDEERIQWLTAGLPISAADTGVEARRGGTGE